MARILIVDDEPSLVTLLTYNLKKSGYEVYSQNDGHNIIETIKDKQIDLILLDVMLPDQNGVEITRDIRAAKIDVPIIMVTALDEEVDKIVGLEIGADDYITKPFSPREVIARIKAVLRRFEHGQKRQEESDNIQTYGNLAIDYDKMAVQLNGENVKLTPKEYELLTYMAQREGRVLDRETILHGVWGYDYGGPDTRMVDMHLSHLRDKVENDPKHPVMLKTVRGMGYRFENPEKAED
ncbi:two-component system alkaline phosphatase synthesis response regulator PhoP [Weissella uvarum]|uniref:response regulator transcription factor n=1 Tax=Weissella uvarum TaxID=1479233 RepID=UPI001961776D|nr:response regulator transcription factor [Weissella uvarum]MBM7617514.1 two-component system alkaline phosphatase synthesis response regulator PhoP [Weissella uvarum]MCM0595602.1 response regulator transcription factor [Weissella uvarum]